MDEVGTKESQYKWGNKQIGQNQISQESKNFISVLIFILLKAGNETCK